MTETSSFDLENVVTRRLDIELVRCVVQDDFDNGKPKSYLYTSGLANRYNPQGVRAVYFSEDVATALAEYDLRFEGLDPPPAVMFRARLVAEAVLDPGTGPTRSRRPQGKRRREMALNRASQLDAPKTWTQTTS